MSALAVLADAFADGSLPAIIAVLVAVEGGILWLIWRTRGVGISRGR